MSYTSTFRRDPKIGFSGCSSLVETYSSIATTCSGVVAQARTGPSNSFSVMIGYGARLSGASCVCISRGLIR